MPQTRVMVVPGEGFPAWHRPGMPGAMQEPVPLRPSPRARCHAAVVSDRHGLSWEAAAKQGKLGHF